MNLVAENKGFEIFFDCMEQDYSVYKDGKFLIGGFFRYSDCETYIK